MTAEQNKKFLPLHRERICVVEDHRATYQANITQKFSETCFQYSIYQSPIVNPLICRGLSSSFMSSLSSDQNIIQKWARSGAFELALNISP